jgi:DNA-binding protein HU-beta
LNEKKRCAVMTKSELIQSVARDTGMSQSQAGKVVNAVFDTIARSLQDGQEVRLTGFGTFRTVETKERPGRNPRTGEEITIPAGRRVGFTAGTGLLGSDKEGDSNKRAA